MSQNTLNSPEQSARWYYDSWRRNAAPSCLERKAAESHGRINTIAFAPNGKLLIAGSEAGKVHLWDLPSGQEQSRFLRHAGSVRALAVAPGGHSLAVAGGHWIKGIGELKLWDLVGGRPTVTLWQQRQPVSAVAFSPDGRNLAAASGNGDIRAWQLDDRERHLQAAHADEVLALQYSPDGRLLASAGADHTIRLWDAKTLDAVHAVMAVPGIVRGLAFAPLRPELLASAGDNSAVRIWDIRTGDYVPVLQNPRPLLVRAVAFRPDSDDLLFAASAPMQGSEVWRWNLSKQARFLVARTPRAIHALDFARDGNTFATGGLDHSVRLWSWEAEDREFDAQAHR
jgi:WD40 repeat protein